MSGFAHLHVHTEYSLLDGACRIERALDAAQKMGQTAMAITDHGTMYGVIEFYRQAKKRGIKPIIGCEVYVAQRTRFDKIHALDSETRHLVLLCKNNTGYQNLIELVSRGYIDGFYNKPRVDRELLEKHSEGLIALSGCLAGEVTRALLKGDYDEAKRVALWHKSVFRGGYYLEIQNHGLDEQLQTNPEIIRLSRETGIPIVVTNDAHYIEKSDAKMQKVLICIQTNHTVDDPNALEFKTNEFYLKSEDGMRELFPDAPEAADNTVKIAQQCDVEFEFGKIKLPHFLLEQDHAEYFKKQCFDGLRKKYGENPGSKIIDRLNYEIDTIQKMGYIDYFLIVADFINFAKANDIPVGPGRGSGAGSLAAYCTGITGVDPIKYNLLFERFLNPERVSMPDFDIDFCYERRPRVIDYVVNKYGADHVAQIITFGTMAARGAIRDVGRALGVPYATADTAAKQVPFELGITITSALESNPELRNMYDNDPGVKELIDMAQKVEGMPRHASTHAAGVVITRDPVSSYVPLQKNDESIITQFPMTTLEELGLLKMDFLGLRNLTVIKDTVDEVRKTELGFDIENIPFDDKSTFAMLAQGFTQGVFQFESGGMRSVLVGLGPECVEDLIAVISLYRPGPMQFIPKYIQNRHNPSQITYKTPLLEKILDVTYGCLIYQEQVIEVFRTLAGYSYGRADIVRRAVSKKKHGVMERERQAFIHGVTDEQGNIQCEGAVKRGVPEHIANEIFNEMTSFASYAFNKSHAAAYAVVAYQTAYLKQKHPKEYMAALLTSVLSSAGQIAIYIAECKRLGIRVLPPDINSSREGFCVQGGDIRFGLLAVKNLGRGFIREILKERGQNGAFKSFYDFCKRMHGRDFNSRALESLIKCGALDSLPHNRSQMLMGAEAVISQLEEIKNKNVEGQIGFFEMEQVAKSGGEEYELPQAEELPSKELLSMEKEAIGIYISGHPIDQYATLIERQKTARTYEIMESKETGSLYRDESKIKIIALVSGLRLKATKSGGTMAYVTLEDMFGTVEMLVFPRTLQDYSHILKDGSVVCAAAKISIREDKDPQLICDYVTSPSEAAPPRQNSKPKPRHNPGLYIKVESLTDGCYLRAKRALDVFDGVTPLYIYTKSDRQLLRAPRDNFVQVNQPLIIELKRILGEENCVVVE